ncbi:MAG: PEP-CTERM sorting domain-containing protein [Proteobacteria bacterium]|nr:PEP-CTERM sorting domain-containing protein [Pseudomonadota bacterium]
MTRVSKGVLAMLAVCTGFSAAPAQSFLVNWDINPSLSSFKLAIPDQNVTIGTLTVTMRLRNQGTNATWTTNTAPVDGLLATDIGPGVGFSSVQFLGGASSLVGLNTGNYRPNPASYSTSVTSTINTAGTFTNTSSGPGVYAAVVRGNLPVLGLQSLGFINFDNVSYDVSSAVTALSGTSFLSNALTLGVLDSRINFDGISVIIAGQVVGDTQGQSGPLNGVNTGAGAGSLVNVGGTQYRITVPVNLPVAISLGGVNLVGTATGTLVGFAFIPEPATAVLVAAGIVALGVRGRRRRLES